MPSFEITTDGGRVFTGEKASLSLSGQLMLRGAFPGHSRTVAIQIHPGVFARADGGVMFTCRPAQVEKLESEVRQECEQLRRQAEERRQARATANPDMPRDRVAWGANPTMKLLGGELSILTFQAELRRRGIRWDTDHQRLNPYSAQIDPQVQREIVNLCQRTGLASTPQPPAYAPSYLQPNDGEAEPGLEQGPRL